MIYATREMILLSMEIYIDNVLERFTNIHFLMTEFAFDAKDYNMCNTYTFILNIIYRPVIFSIIGYIMMLCVSTFYQVAPIKERSVRIIKALIFILVVIYVFIVGPLLLSAIIPFKLPTIWSKAAYMILGALPSSKSPFSLYSISFLLGVLFWLSNHVQDKTKG